jgi:hypothetical protein
VLIFLPKPDISMYDVDRGIGTARFYDRDCKDQATMLVYHNGRTSIITRTEFDGGQRFTRL